jgi:formylglycine-generating enzyme required for sulfatase activity
LTNGQPTGAQGLTTTEDGSYYLNGATTDAELLAVTRKAPEQGGRFYIPTEDEWYKAAYYDPDKPGGAGYWDYPTRSDDPDIPNNGNPEGDTGNTANFYDLDYTIGSPYYRTPVGQFQNSEGPYGTFDQGGNVHEWNEDVFTSMRIFRGGSWGQGYTALYAGYPFGTGPSGESTYLGFRIAEVPEPGATSLLAVGALAILRRRKIYPN